MKIIKMSQTEDIFAWKEFRRGKSTGTKSGPLKPLSRGTDRTPMAFWHVAAERISIAPGDETARERGLRVENEGLFITAKKLGIEIDADPGVWVSDVREDMILSPDAQEPGDKPTYAFENKAFDTGKHLQIIVGDVRAKRTKSYNPFNSIPKDNQDQALDYFVINDDLQELHWSLYDDRVALEHLEHHIITVKRSDVEDLIEGFKFIQIDQLNKIEKLIEEIQGEEYYV